MTTPGNRRDLSASHGGSTYPTTAPGDLSVRQRRPCPHWLHRRVSSRTASSRSTQDGRALANLLPGRASPARPDANWALEYKYLQGCLSDSPIVDYPTGSQPCRPTVPTSLHPRQPPSHPVVRHRSTRRYRTQHVVHGVARGRGVQDIRAARAVVRRASYPPAECLLEPLQCRKTRLLAVIRSGGHHLRGRYDVPNGQEYDTPASQAGV